MPVDLTVPAWLHERCEFWVARLGLHDWEIEIGLSFAPNDDATNLGSAHNQADRSWAAITLRADVEDNREWEIVLVHELLHVKHSRIDDVVQEVLAPHVSGAPQAMVDSLYRRAVEPYIHSLARALVILHRREYEVSEVAQVEAKK